MALSTAELIDLQKAKSILENPGLVAKISNLVGSPIEVGLKKLPDSWNSAINAATRKSIEKALDIALMTMNHDNRESSPSNWWHKAAAGASGAAGGLFGLPALVLELPVSTSIILRSIADIARSEGEDLSAADGKLQCIQVLTLGGKLKGDDLTDTGYFAARTAFAKALSEAAEHLATKGLSQKGAPVIINLIAKVAARFSIVVSQKAAAQAIPVVGAFGGAAINALFMDHFQDMGRGHFIVRRLERLHGQDEIRRLYDTLGKSKLNVE